MKVIIRISKEYMSETLNEFLKFRNWVRGIIGAFIGGSANTISNTIIDPKDFNIHDSEGIHNLVYSALVTGVISAALYLKQHNTWED